MLLHLHQLHERRRIERTFAREEFIEHQTQRIDVALESDLSARELFGRHVGRRAAANIALQLFAQSGEAEVHDDDVAAAVDHHICRFQIAMQHAFFMRGGQPGAQVAGSFDSFIRGQAADAPQQ